MRIAIVGTILAAALAASGAYAQNTQMQITGNKAFCMKMTGGKVNCSFDTMATCQKEIGKLGTPSEGSCLPRGEVR